MYAFVIIVTTVFIALYMKRLMDEETLVEESKDLANSGTWRLEKARNAMVNQYCLPALEYFISSIYSVYEHFKLINLTVFFMKYVPTGLTGIYTFRVLRNIFKTSRERIKKKQNQLDDIQLQIQIIETKLCVRDAEFSDRTELLRRDSKRLRRLRARVREMIAADELMKKVLEGSAGNEADLGLPGIVNPEDERDYLLELLKELKYDHVILPDRVADKLECVKRSKSEHNSPEHSVYSSLSDVEVKQDCRVRIVKVTNVYKVAYLKHYIKQKKLRRASKFAHLKKKMEIIKSQLDEWQKSLNAVLRNKLDMFGMESRSDLASDVASGDFSKTRFPLDSDSDKRNEYEDYCINRDIPDSAINKEIHDISEMNHHHYHQHFSTNCENGHNLFTLHTLPEETPSTVAMSEECDVPVCRDLLDL